MFGKGIREESIDLKRNNDCMANSKRFNVPQPGALPKQILWVINTRFLYRRYDN